VRAYESFDRHKEGWLEVELLPHTPGSNGAPRETRLVNA
jgi:hypothetical protein